MKLTFVVNFSLICFPVGVQRPSALIGRYCLREGLSCQLQFFKRKLVVRPSLSYQPRRLF